MGYDFLTTGEESMAAVKVSRLQKRGQVTIPTEIRQKLGLEEGDLVAFIETPAGVVISPQEVIPAATLEKMESYFQQRGISLDELFAFAARLENRDREGVIAAPAETSPAETSVVQQTAGIFARRDRQKAIDFKAVRRQFIEETAANVQAESSNRRK
jgi:AbrB family looped-hinge helix DNA binding protein